jgi:ribosomal protein L32
MSMSLRRYRNTDAQEEALGELDEVARKIKVPAKGDKLVGTVCGYCGFSRAEDLPKQKAKVGHVGWLDVGQETAQKVGKFQLENKLYTLEVCPACGAIIDVIEKKR